MSEAPPVRLDSIAGASADPQPSVAASVTGIQEGDAPIDAEFLCGESRVESYTGSTSGAIRSPARSRRKRRLAATSTEFWSGDCLRPAAGGCAGSGSTAIENAHDRYDRVLVDAECTHDGSIKHLAKFELWGWDTFEARFLSADRLSALVELQRGLLAAGFRALKPGGTLVYSTCSFARAQNEDLVGAFLASEQRARLEPIGALVDAPCKPGALKGTLRFEPRISNTSGLFVAKLRKLPAPETSHPIQCVSYRNKEEAAEK